MWRKLQSKHAETCWRFSKESEFRAKGVMLNLTKCHSGDFKGNIVSQCQLRAFLLLDVERRGGTFVASSAERREVVAVNFKVQLKQANHRGGDLEGQGYDEVPASTRLRESPCRSSTTSLGLSSYLPFCYHVNVLADTNINPISEHFRDSFCSVEC